MMCKEALLHLESLKNHTASSSLIKPADASTLSSIALITWTVSLSTACIFSHISSIKVFVAER